MWCAYNNVYYAEHVFSSFVGVTTPLQERACKEKTERKKFTRSRWRKTDLQNTYSAHYIIRILIHVCRTRYNNKNRNNVM